MCHFYLYRCDKSKKMSGFILPLPDSRLLGRIFQKAQNFDKTPRNHVAEMALESL